MQEREAQKVIATKRERGREREGETGREGGRERERERERERARHLRSEGIVVHASAVPGVECVSDQCILSTYPYLKIHPDMPLC